MKSKPKFIFQNASRLKSPRFGSAPISSEPMALATGSPRLISRPLNFGSLPKFWKVSPEASTYGSEKKVAGHKESRRLAFSLVELMVVMIIIGLLSSLVAVQTRSYLIASKQNAARAEIATMVSALESFYADQSRYPTNDEGIEILTQGTKAFPDGFLKKLPVDPWRNPYEYVSPGAKSPFEIICLGADGREGGEGGDADISSEALDAKTK